MRTIGGGNFKTAVGLGLFILIATGAFAADKAALAKTSFAPADVQRTLLTVRERGYYSLQAKSKTGTALELVDRMAGVIGSLSGAPGERDGRIDLLLDPGEYRVNLYPDRNASDSAELAVLPFKEANPAATLADFPFLYDGDSLKTFLNDLETRSYWIYLPERAELRLEIMGRCLKSCALWQNGQWLTAVRPDYSEREPVKGRPVLFAEFHSQLEAGHYLLVCAGGQKRAWAEEDQDISLYIRRGARFLGSNGVQKLRISPFGRDAYLIAGSADYVECVRDTLEPTRLSVGYYGVGRSRYEASSNAEITKQSKEPWCRLYSGSGGDKKWLVVEAKPGDLLEVSFFHAGGGTGLPYDRWQTKSYWVSTVSGYAARNLIDLTPLVYTTANRHVTFLKEGAIRVSAAAPFVRKVNSLGVNSVYLFVEAAGTYRVSESATAGGKARYRFTLLEDRFTTGGTTEFKTPDKPFELVRGYYVLDLQPTSLGILHFALYKDGSQRPDELLRRDPPDPRYAVAWPSVTVPADTSASFTANARYDLAVGVDVRELPLSLAVPLSALLAPGESVEVSVKVDRDAVLSVEADKFSLTVSGKKTENGASLSPGVYAFNLKNESTNADLVTLYTVDALSLQRFPKPVLKSFEDTFPVFTEKTPYYDDWDRGQTRNLLLRVTEPALYRIETSGRLALGLAVRTPLVVSLISAGENGPGRNSLIESYLKPGDYLVSVTAHGQSRGRAGVALTKTPFSEEGTLPPDVTSRRTVEADIGLRYGLAVDKTEKYALSTYGLGVSFPFRLEDDEGFPLTTGTVGTTREFAPGAYVYYSLPIAFVTRRLTSFRKIPEPEAEAAGAKRFVLALNRPRQNTWQESEGRAPDVFAFTLPAPLSVTVSLSAGMRGELSGPGLADPVILADGRAQSLDLQTGEFNLSVRAQEERNLFPYSAAVSTSMLAAGIAYPLSSGTNVFVVSAAGDNIYDFASSGLGDFKASLWDETGTKLIAANDDMESDWNFRITQRLPAGRYLLRVEPAGYLGGGSSVAMAINPENPLPEKKLPFTVEQNLAREILRIPVRAEADGVFAARATTGRAVKLGLYRGTDLLAEGEGFLALPLVKDRTYTLQIWQSDDMPQRVSVSASFASPPAVTLSGAPGTYDCPAFLALNNPEGLSFRLADRADQLLFSSGPEAPFREPGPWVATAPGARGYLAVKSGRNLSKLRIEPVVVVPDKPETVFVSSLTQSFLADLGSSDVCLLSAETQDRPCGLALLPKNGDKSKAWYDFKGMDVSGNRTFALLPPSGRSQAIVWNLEPVLPGRLDTRAALRFARFPAATGRLKKGEVKTFRLEPGKGLRLELDAGPQSIRLLLGRFCAASVWKDGRPAATAAADEENRDVRFAAAGGLLLVANYGGAMAVVKAEAAEAPAATVSVLDAGGLETALAGEGRLVVAVPAGHEKELLCLAGSGFEARLLGANGRLVRAVPQDRPGHLAVLSAQAGELEIDYTGGWIRIFFAQPGKENEGLASRSPGLRAKPIAGQEQLSGKESLFSFTMDADAFAVVTCDAPGLVALYGNNKPLALRAGLEGGTASIVYRLPKGSYEIYARPIRGTTQTGTLSLRRVVPVTLAGKNEEKDFFIGRDEVQVFRFAVTEAGEVGVGLSEEADRLRAELYDSASNLLGTGGLLFRTLGKGTYYLAVYGGDLPVRYQPLVYGVEGSVAGVPPDVVNQYKNSGSPPEDEYTGDDSVRIEENQDYTDDGSDYSDEGSDYTEEGEK
jgi:hypothetical protein